MSAGLVQYVEEVRAGSELAADAALSATELVVEDPADFSEEGGELELEGTELGYESVDLETATITLDALLADAAVTGEAVYVAPVTIERFAHVLIEGQEETLQARVPHALYDRLPVGIREEVPEPELVELARDRSGELVVADVLNREPLVDASFIDPDTTVPPEALTDGVAPASSPTPTVRGAIGFLLAVWAAVANADPVTYEVHVSTSTGFTPDAATLAGQTPGTFFSFRTLPDGTALVYGTTYYVKLVAKDADGSAAAGAQGSAGLVQIDSPDIVADAITADHILADSAFFNLLMAVLIVANTFSTGGAAGRVDISETEGIEVFAADGATLLAHFPSDGSDPYVAGHLDAAGVDLVAGTTGTPPDDRRARWLRESDGAVVADLYGFEITATGQRALVERVLRRDAATGAQAGFGVYDSTGSTLEAGIAAVVEDDDSTVVFFQSQAYGVTFLEDGNGDSHFVRASSLGSNEAPTAAVATTAVNSDLHEGFTAAEIIALAYPVGSVYISVVSTNPATLLGFGTWAAFATGRTLVGIDTGDTDFDTVEETRGAKTHTLTLAESAAHDHGGVTGNASGQVDAVSAAARAFPAAGTASGFTTAHTHSISSAGGGGAHNNIQPSIVVYMWKRTA